MTREGFENSSRFHIEQSHNFIVSSRSYMILIRFERSHISFSTQYLEVRRILTPVGCHLALYTSPAFPLSVCRKLSSFLSTALSGFQSQTFTVLSPLALRILSPRALESTSQIRELWPRRMVGGAVGVTVDQIRRVLSLS